MEKRRKSFCCSPGAGGTTGDLGDVGTRSGVQFQLVWTIRSHLPHLGREAGEGFNIFSLHLMLEYSTLSFRVSLDTQALGQRQELGRVGPLGGTWEGYLELAGHLLGEAFGL